jgi:hypothetical protein
MIEGLKLLLPAIIPSWRFFDRVTASPRIEFSIISNEKETPSHWQEFRPRPQHVSLITMLKRMASNSRWNESLFLVSCAERIMENPTAHSKTEIAARICLELKAEQEGFMKFRLVFICREGETLHSEIMFISDPYPLSEEAG